MKVYLCCICYSGVDKMHDSYPRLTLVEADALAWKIKTQKHENAAARDGFSGLQKFVVRTGGELPDEGPTMTIDIPGSGAGEARVFELEAKEI